MVAVFAVGISLTEFTVIVIVAEVELRIPSETWKLKLSHPL